MRRIRTLLTVLSSLGLVGTTAAGSAAAMTVGHVRVAINSDASFANARYTADHEQVVILQSWDTSELRALKAANPAVKVLMYQNASSASTSAAADGRYATGISYPQAAANGWLLRTRSGSPFTFGGYPWLYATDIGAPAYQRAWSATVLNRMGSDPWDGVFIDDVNPTIKWHYCVSCVAKYPSDAKYGAAMARFVHRVGPRLRAAGKLAVANIGSWSGYTSVADPWLRSLSGAMDENFLKWGTQVGVGYADQATWAIQLHELQLSAAEGKLFIGISHSGPHDQRAAVYGYATELLGGAGRAVFSMASNYSGESWFPEYGYTLGAPLGAQKRTAGGIHERQFARGLVLVNPTGSRLRVRLTARYRGSGFKATRVVTMAPQTGAVLVRASRTPMAVADRHSRTGAATGGARGHRQPAGPLEGLSLRAYAGVAASPTS
jgi:hypothetical protein